MDNRQFLSNPLPYALRMCNKTKDYSWKYSILLSLVKYYVRVGEANTARKLFYETLPEVRAICSVKDRSNKLYYYMLPAAVELGLVEQAKKIINELERIAGKLKRGSSERRWSYEYVVHGYALIGNYKKAAYLAMKVAEKDLGPSFGCIVKELIKAKRDDKAIQLLKSVRKRPSRLMSNVDMFMKIFHEDNNYILLIMDMVKTYAEMGEIRKAESLINKMGSRRWTSGDEWIDRMGMYVTIAHHQREHGKRSSALKFLNKANRLRKKQKKQPETGALSDNEKYLRRYEIGEQLSLAEEYALLGNKSHALSIASECLSLTDTKPDKKSYDYLSSIQAMAIVYGLCGKRAKALHIAKAGDLNRYRTVFERYQIDKMAALCSKKIEAGQFKGACRLLNRIDEKLGPGKARLRMLDHALNFYAKKNA